MGVVVGFLLVFNSNISYSRFWEGRCIWGMVKNTCIDIAMSLCGEAGVNLTITS